MLETLTYKKIKYLSTRTMDLCVDKLPKRGTGLKKKTWNNNDLTLTPPELHAAKAVMCTMWYPRIGFYGEKFSGHSRSPFQPSQLKKADPTTATATRMTKKQ